MTNWFNDCDNLANNYQNKKQYYKYVSYKLNKLHIKFGAI